LKSSATLNDRFVKKLAKFVGEDNDDQVLDERLAPKLKKKKKSKQQKVRDRAEKRRKLMREVLEDSEQNNNELETGIEQVTIQDQPLPKKSRKQRKQKKLDILTTDELLAGPEVKPEQAEKEPIVENEEIEVPLRKKAKVESKSTLAELADKIRNDIDQGRENEEADGEPQSKKKKKQLKGENFEFIKVNKTAQPTGSAFMTRAQRKMKRGKIEKGNQNKVNKASMKAMMEKQTTLKFDKDLVKIKPFKKLDKPEVVGSHQGKLKVHDPEKTPTKSALRVKTTPKRVGKVKWQG